MAYNPIQNQFYMQSSLDNNPSNPNNNLENILRNNPNNLHKNERGSAGMKILIAGGIAVLVVGGIVYALNPFSNNETLPTPTPYTPPAVTTQVPTETPKPTEPSLEDKLPAYAPLSTTQIKEYTLTALQLAYEAKTQKDVDRSRAWLDRALYALKISNFEEEKYLALYEATDEWEYITISTNEKARIREYRKKDAAEAAKNPDKDYEIKMMKAALETVLGMAPDSRGSR